MLNRFVLSALILLPSSFAGAQQTAGSPAPARESARASAQTSAQAAAQASALASVRASRDARASDEARAAAVARGPLAPWPMLAGSESARGEWGARYPQDPADSVYRDARSQLNRGEWRRASTLFGQVAQRQPASAYAADALYWQAFALYRIGGVTELREALAALDSRKSRFPRAGNGEEAERLTTRVSGALAARGDASAQGRVRASASGAATSCDSEDLSVRASALSVLMRNNPEQAMPIATKVLERRDECSVSLRRNAVMMVGNTGDAASRAKLLDVAKTDPSPSVRSEAVGYLGKSGEEVVPMLESVIRSDSSESVQRSAVRALGANPTPKARAAIRALVERSSAPERLRLEALSTFDRGAGQYYSTFCAGGESCLNLTGTTGLVEERFREVRGGTAMTAPTPAPLPRPAPVPAVAPVAPVAPVPPVGSATGFGSSSRGLDARAYAEMAEASGYTFSRSGDETTERRISPEDAAWLRGVYPRLETTRLKSSAASVLTRAADEPTTTWLMALVQREEEPSEVRGAILARLGRDLPIVNLSRLYDTGSSRTLRQQVMQVLGARTEPEATDKLIEIARTGTDPQLRQSAISALSRKKDPRTMQLLLELIDR